MISKSEQGIRELNLAAKEAIKIQAANPNMRACDVKRLAFKIVRERLNNPVKPPSSPAPEMKVSSSIPEAPPASPLVLKNQVLIQREIIDANLLLNKKQNLVKAPVVPEAPLINFNNLDSKQNIQQNQLPQLITPDVLLQKSQNLSKVPSFSKEDKATLTMKLLREGKSKLKKVESQALDANSKKIEKLNPKNDKLTDKLINADLLQKQAGLLKKVSPQQVEVVDRYKINPKNLNSEQKLIFSAVIDRRQALKEDEPEQPKVDLQQQDDNQDNELFEVKLDPVSNNARGVIDNINALLSSHKSLQSVISFKYMTKVADNIAGLMFEAENALRQFCKSKSNPDNIILYISDNLHHIQDHKTIFNILISLKNNINSDLKILDEVFNTIKSSFPKNLLGGVKGIGDFPNKRQVLEKAWEDFLAAMSPNDRSFYIKLVPNILTKEGLKDYEQLEKMVGKISILNAYINILIKKLQNTQSTFIVRKPSLNNNLPVKTDNDGFEEC